MRGTMDLHTPNDTPDWTLISSKDANAWQRLALATRGVITPANIVSVMGLLLVTWGADDLRGNAWVFGLSLIAMGRLADLADGLVANYTKTKSRFGEAVDATCDKLAIGIIVIAALVAHVIPVWFLAVILAYNIYLTFFGLMKGRKYHLHASRYAKLAIFASWLALLGMVIYVERPSTLMFILVAIMSFAYGVLAVFALYTYHRDLYKATSERQALTKWPHELTDIVSIANKRASHYERATRLLNSLSTQLKLRPVEIDVVEHEQVLQKFLREHAKKHTILITIAGGDGTVSSVVNTLMRLQPQFPHNRYYILPLWGGNANDLAYMLNGLSNATSSKRLLSESSTASIPLIQVEISNSGTEARTTFACCYASFGASAYAARRLDMYRFSTHKLLRWLPPFLVLRELIFVLRAVAEAPLYLIEIEREEKTFYEHTIINGSRIAKVDRIPISLAQPEFFHALVTRKEPSIIISLIRVMLGKPDVVYANRTKLQFKTKTPVDAQIDGEVLQLSANTHVSAKIVSNELRFISTKLRTTT